MKGLQSKFTAAWVEILNMLVLYCFLYQYRCKKEQCYNNLTAVKLCEFSCTTLNLELGFNCVTSGGDNVCGSSFIICLFSP